MCFGHQIVGRALDVKVDRSDAGWEVAVTPMALTARGKQLFGVDRDMVSTIPFTYAHDMEVAAGTSTSNVGPMRC